MDSALQSSQSQSGSQDAFDGAKLCLAVRDELEGTHRKLMGPDKRQAFDREWTNTCTTDPRTKTEQGSDQLAEEMISSLGERFDHYFDRQGMLDLKTTQSGEDVGIGIDTEIKGAGELRQPQPYEAKISQEHPLEITGVLADSPASRVGLQVGDRISAVNGESLNGLKRRQFQAKTEGTNGTLVSLDIWRPQADGSFKEENIETKEDLVREPAATYRSLEGGVGYVKLRNFMADDAADQMSNAIGQTSPDKAIVIDLRNNGGGRVGTMEEIAEEILEKGRLLTTVERGGDKLVTENTDLDNRGNVQKTGSDRDQPLVYPRLAYSIIAPSDKPIVVLVDAYSASAAEMLAGLLRTNHRATIVGEPTTGKSEGQKLCDFPYGRGASLTYFEFYPGGEPVPHTGLKPDVLVPRGDDATTDNQLEQARKVAISLYSRKGSQN